MILLQLGAQSVKGGRVHVHGKKVGLRARREMGEELLRELATSTTELYLEPVEVDCHCGRG